MFVAGTVTKCLCSGGFPQWRFHCTQRQMTCSLSCHLTRCGKNKKCVEIFGQKMRKKVSIMRKHTGLCGNFNRLQNSASSCEFLLML